MSASPAASANPTSRTRDTSSSVPAAAPKRAVKTISGRRDPALAAAKGLLGIRLTRNSTRLGSSCASRGAAEGTAISGANPRPIHIVPIPITIAGNTVTQKKAKVVPPRRPSFLGSPRFATPVKITAITSGITTIRIALTKAVPSGAEARATVIMRSEPAAASRPVPSLG